MKKILLALIFFSCFVLGIGQQVFDKEGIPFNPNTENALIVIDGSPNLFSNQETQLLEKELENFRTTTNIEINLVLIPFLNGFEVDAMAEKIVTNWNYPNSSEDGIILLIKPQGNGTSEKAFIETSPSLKSHIAKNVAKRIIETELEPYFNKQQYYEGVHRSIKALYSISTGELTGDEYISRTNSYTKYLALLPLILAGIFLFFFFKKYQKRNFSSHATPFWSTIWLGGSTSVGSAGGWSEFSSSSGSFSANNNHKTGGGGAGGSW